MSTEDEHAARPPADTTTEAAEAEPAEQAADSELEPAAELAPEEATPAADAEPRPEQVEPEPEQATPAAEPEPEQAAPSAEPEPEQAAPPAEPEQAAPSAEPEPEQAALPAEPEPEQAAPPAEPEPEPAAPFAALGVSPWLVDALAAEGIVEPTPIQALAIPPLLAGRDIIGQARTGTGKTAAFTVPLLERIDVGLRAVQAVVLAPTRELAVQVARVVKSFGRSRRGLRVVAIYGGSSYTPQLRALDRGAQVVVGTPGRIIDLADRGALLFDQVHTVVLDEADEMLQMGFIDDISTILDAMPPAEERQVALFSATMPPPIRRIANRYQRDPVDARTAEAGEAVSAIEQEVVFAADRDWLEVLDRLLRVEQPEQALMFVATREATADLATALYDLGHQAAAISGAMSQSQRTEVLHRFRSGELRILVGTDVAARGLDVDGITHVFNIGPPTDPASYVHRIGRTGRAGRAGRAVTLCTPRERHRIRRIEQRTDAIMTRRRWPSLEEARAHRVSELVARLATVATDPARLAPYRAAIDTLVDQGFDPRDLAAAAARMADGARPMEPVTDDDDREWVPFVLSIGGQQRIRPGDVVGALCNEVGLARGHIGYVEVDRRYSVAWLSPSAAVTVGDGGVVYVRGRPANIWPDGQPPPPPPRRDRDPGRQRSDRSQRGPDDRRRGRGDHGDRRGRNDRYGGRNDRYGGRNDRNDRNDRYGDRRDRRGPGPAHRDRDRDRGSSGETPFSGWKGRQGRRGRSTRHRNDEH